MQKTQIICFGETLWDIFPEGERIGGAPLNVAYHLHQLGLGARIISRIGNDEWGRRLKQQVKAWGLSADTLQEDFVHETSKVLAHVKGNGETTYEIVKPVAWDFIEREEAYRSLARVADALVFGSLAFRSPDSRETLLGMIEESRFTVFDVNLRPPHYIEDQILEVFEQVNLLKLNNDELQTISGWLGYEKESEADQVKRLRDQFSMEEVLVTKGSEGARYFADGEDIVVKAVRVKVVNTVGSGDAFLAAFLSRKFGEMTFSLKECLEEAAVLGAFVASKDGACPDYSEEELGKFKNQDV